MNKALFEYVKRRWEALRSARSSWLSHWDECAHYTRPHQSNLTLPKDSTPQEYPSLYITSPQKAVDDMASGLASYMTPPDKRWFSIRSRDADARDDVSGAFEQVTVAVHKALKASGFDLTASQVYTDLAVFGTALHCVMPGKERADGTQMPLSMRVYRPGSYCFEEDETGRPDVIFREQHMTARQAVMEFGEDNVHENVIKLFNDHEKSARDMVHFVHAVFPRTDRDTTKRDVKNKPYASVWIDVTNNHLCRESGFDSNPYQVARMTLGTGEVYGSSQTRLALPTIRTMNQIMMDVLKSTEKALNPPIIQPDATVISKGFSLKPGSINYYRQFIPNAKPEPFIVPSPVQLAVDLLQYYDQRISELYYLDVFKALAMLEEKRMTAREALLRVEEKLVLFSPMLGRIQADFLSPVIHRAMGVVLSNPASGLIEEGVAQMLAGQDYEIDYMGRLAQAMRAIENRSFLETMAAFEMLVEAQPNVLDNLNLDEASRDVARNYGFPEKWLRKQREVRQVREERAEIERQMREAEMARNMAPMERVVRNG